MSHMKEVAKLLGVEIGEKFKVDANGVILQKNFFFTDYGLFVIGGAGPMAGILNDLLNDEYTVIKLPKPILDEKEKEYLSNVIKPFRDDVKCIIKDSVDYVEWITICMKTCHDMDFPIFGVGTMYKGMEPNKEYTLEELEL